MQVGPCILVGTQLEKAELGPTSGPTWRLPHVQDVVVNALVDAVLLACLGEGRTA